MRVIEGVVGDIPAAMVPPDPISPYRQPVLWLSHLGGSVDAKRPMMARFTERGCPVVSFDAPGHGRRASSTDPRVFATEVLASLRQLMWPLLGMATIEAMRVVTWALQHVGGDERPVFAGGVSMGGDVTIALAGADHRIRRVAAVGSSPDWERPGMHSLIDPSELIDQGRADRYAHWFAEQLSPVRQVETCLRDVAITFESGGDDHHIPAENARAFRATLIGRDRTTADRVRVSVHPDLGHVGVTTDEHALHAAVDRLAPDSST